MSKILIVDDQPDNVYVLERLLRGQGYSTIQAASGEEALRLATSDQPDLVLLDVMMPGMDGFEVVQHLRGDASTRALPVVLLTANAPDQRLKIQGLNLGADEYLTQPINNSELLARVRALLRSKQSQDALQSVNQRLQALLSVVQASSSTLDLSEVGERVVRGAMRAAGMDMGGIWLCEGPDLVALTQLGYSAKLIADRQRITPASSRFTLQVVETQQPIYGETTTLYGPADPVTAEMASVILLPLVQRDQSLGVLLLGSRKPYTFEEENLEFLQAIANAGQTAVQNAQRFTESVHSRQTLESMDQEKDEFISIISHELKNPLASIKGYASLLQRRARRDPALEPTVKGLEVIEQQVGRMTQLLDQLRDVSHIGIKRFAIEPHTLDMADLVERVAKELQGTTQHHELLLTITDAPLLAEVDEFRMTQVLSNLIGNAIKYSSDDTAVDITVGRTPAAPPPTPLPGDDWVYVSVSDQGIGIPADEQERLFERFFRANNAKSKASGMGLGLFIAREIVQLHGGQMWVRSVAGRGSTFSIAVPLIHELEH